MKQIILGFILILCAELSLASGRSLLVISELDHRGIPELQPLYEKLESLTWALPQQSFLLKKAYQKMELLRNEQATKSGVIDFLIQNLMDSQIEKIDVILSVHGTQGKLAFFDGSIRVEELVRNLKVELQKKDLEVLLSKLGFMYNLSCYGSTHIEPFLSLGFEAVIGSRRVNANAELEYPWVLEGLALGRTLESVFVAPNSSRWLELADGPVRWIGYKQNNFLKEVDSFKLIEGNRQFRIYR